MSDTESTAVAALREAARALRIGEDAETGQGRIPESDKPDLAGEVAQLLDAVVGLLRTVDLDPVPTSAAGHTLHAVTQHLTAGADLARGAAGPDRPGSSR